MRRAFLCLAIAVMEIVLASPACRSAALTPSEVVKNLDVTSFPNSIRPRSRPGARSFAQYGFTQIVPVEGHMVSVDVYEPGHAWLFRITVLRSEGSRATVCVLDEALNGGTYLTQMPLELQRREDGLLHAIGRNVSDPRCSRSER